MDYLKKSKLFYLIVLFIGALIFWSQIKEIEVLARVFSITVNTLLVPVIISVFIYYMLKPLYLFLVRKLKNELTGLVLTLIIFLTVGVFLIRNFIPVLVLQVEMLLDNLPRLLVQLDQRVIASQLFDGRDINHYLSLINQSFEDLVSILFVGVRNSTTLLMELISSSFLIVSIVPILVIFMLKNTGKPKKMHNFLPEPYRKLSLRYLIAVEKTLSDYIGGKASVCFYVFLGAWLTFTIAGLKGALLFAVVAGIMDIIPYFGPWIGAFPALLSALISPDVNIWIIIIGILIVQLGESYVVTPYVMSKEMKLNTLVVIIVMLITGQAFGLIGMIIILPIVAVLRLTLGYLLDFLTIQKTIRKERDDPAKDENN